MVSILTKIFAARYQPLNRILIDKNQLLKNYHTLSNLNPKVIIAPVIKSNAYGHGLPQVAPIIDNQQPPFICLDSLAEANILKKMGVKSQILIMGSIAKESLTARLPFQLTITSKDALQDFIRLQPQAQVHLFIDTGMNREGVPLEDLEEVLGLLKESNLKLVGLMTHLAIAYDQNHPLTKKQLENWQQARQMVAEAKFAPIWFHIGGSDCLSWISPDLFNLVRTGRLLYGVQPRQLEGLKPISQLETSIVQIKQLKKGSFVGYSATFMAQNDMTIALLPIGYNDGVDKRLSNKGVVLINGTECPILGLISMNMTVVDITNLSEKAKVGDKVVVFSHTTSDQNSIENSANKAETNPSDLLVGLHPATRREVH